MYEKKNIYPSPKWRLSTNIYYQSITIIIIIIIIYISIIILHFEATIIGHKPECLIVIFESTILN